MDIKRYHVYERLTQKQLARIWNPDAIRNIDGNACRIVAMGITADMVPMWTGKRYIVQEAGK